jgi:hypothetical protein
LRVRFHFIASSKVNSEREQRFAAFQDGQMNFQWIVEGHDDITQKLFARVNPGWVARP